MIVGLAGYARSGKDTAATGLTDYGFQQVAFADILREFLYRLNPSMALPKSINNLSATGYSVRATSLQEVIDKYGWGGYKESAHGGEIRELLQRLGTECGRQLIDDEIWIRAALDGKEGDLVVTDVRFPNEAHAIRDRGGIVIRIVRPGVGAANSHSSETALDDFKFDAIIPNDGSVADLHADLRSVVAFLTEDPDLYAHLHNYIS
jgi:hypothetical protein